MGVVTILVPGNTDLAGLDAMADESKVNVAVLTDPSSQARVIAALAGHGKRVGIGIDTGLWVQQRLNVASSLAPLKDRLLYVKTGAAARNAGYLTAFFNELNRLNIRPLALTLKSSNRDRSTLTSGSAFTSTIDSKTRYGFTVPAP
jgi:hypothetical protein